MSSQSIDELLAAVGSTAPVSEKKESKNSLRVREFIRDAKVKSGSMKIGCPVIYIRYLRYARGTIPLSFRQFFICFSKFFIKYRTNTLRYYLLDPSCFQLPADYSIYSPNKLPAVERARQPSSEYKYVYLNKVNKKWDAIVRENGKLKRLGSFKKEIDAAFRVKTYLEAEMSKGLEKK